MRQISHLRKPQVTHVGTSMGSTWARLHGSGDMNIPSKANRDVHLHLLRGPSFRARLERHALQRTTSVTSSTPQSRQALSL